MRASSHPIHLPLKEMTNETKSVLLVAILSVMALTTGAASAEELQWEKLGRRDDYEISWAKNLRKQAKDSVMTMMRFKYDKPDQAPNNARFDNERFGVDIRCDSGTYNIIGVSYNFGNRQVYNQSMPDADYKPYAGTFIEKFATKVCPAAANRAQPVAPASQ